MLCIALQCVCVGMLLFIMIFRINKCLRKVDKHFGLCYAEAVCFEKATELSNIT